MNSNPLINSPVLVLNQNYQPLNICDARRAIILLCSGKAELLVNGQGRLHSIGQLFPLPVVIRLMCFVRRPVVKSRLSRQGVFLRDGYTCQYCGRESKELTLDHIEPRSRNGPHVWENVVSACILCNHRKAGRTPSEASMRLIREPKALRPHPYHFFLVHPILEEWREFMPWAG